MAIYRPEEHEKTKPIQTQLVLEIEEMFDQVIEALETNDTAVVKESHLSIQGIVNIWD